jgi:hypothetical protein
MYTYKRSERRAKGQYARVQIAISRLFREKERGAIWESTDSYISLVFQQHSDISNNSIMQLVLQQQPVEMTLTALLHLSMQLQQQQLLYDVSS